MRIQQRHYGIIIAVLGPFCETPLIPIKIKNFALKNISPYYQCPNTEVDYLNITYKCMYGSKSNSCNSENPCGNSRVCCRRLGNGCKECLGNLKKT